MTTTTADRFESFCTLKNLQDKLRLYIESHHGHQSDAAAIWGCSPPFVNAILRGRRGPSPQMLQDLGYEKVKGYVQETGGAKHALLIHVDGVLPFPEKTPIKVLWLAADLEDHRRVTVSLRESIRACIDNKYGNRVKAAEMWGCSTGLVSHVLSGAKLPTESMLSDLGLKKIAGYREMSASHTEFKK